MTKALVERWTGQQGDVLAGLARGRPPAPFGLVDGLVDLRGLPVSGVRGGHVKKLSAEGVDLSYSDWEQVRVERSRFADVRFDAVEARSLGDHGNTFERCSFDRANLGGSAIGFDGSRYVSCSFGRTKFTLAVFARAEFDDCVFEDAALRGVDFHASSFERCTFRGTLDDVWFRGGYPLPELQKQFGRARPNRMRDVDLSGAVLDFVTFSDGCDLSTVRLRPDGTQVHFDRWQARVDAAIAAATDDEVRLFVRAFQAHAKTQGEYVLDATGLEVELGKERTAEVLRLLRAG